MGASTVLSIVYDLPTISSPNDPTVVKINQFLDRLLHYALPWNYFVEFFTWMKYLSSSIAKWKKEAEEGYKEYSEMFVGLLHDVEDQIVLSFMHFFSPPD